jgi:two-component system, OmpR family, osmolarity sensor histidine kinase EnvZ
VRISLFWRTFALIALVVVVSVLAWFQLFRAAERQPRAERFAWEVASVVNLTRAGLLSASAERRRELLADLARDEGVRVLPLEPADRVEPWPDRRLRSLIEVKLRELLGPPSRIAASVNGERGLWISFDIEGDPYWLLLDAARLDRQANRDWLGWLGIALLLALLGALAISRVVNRPLAQLAAAIDRLSRGEPAPRLKEDAPTEIAEVNRRFNRMAADLAALEVDRSEALAGISHDIRTPLTRLRMEIELSPLPPRDKESMGEEIERIDAIVRQFVEFARPARAGAPQRVDVAGTIAAVLDGFRNGPEAGQVAVRVDVPTDLGWTGQPTALARIVANLVENARRYGRTSGTDRADVTVQARRQGREVTLAVRDHGPGVPPDQLERLPRPFTRLDEERNRHGGAGLGLAIVARLAHRYGGELRLRLPGDGGLLVTVTLRDDPAASPPGP